MASEIEKLASGWIMEHSLPNRGLPDDVRKFEYYDILADLIRDDPSSALDAVMQMLNITDDEIVISNIAAGPLEDLIARSGPQLIDRIENEARQSSRLRFALRGVWKNLSSDAVWERIDRVRNIP